MRRFARFVGIVCGVAFVALLVFMIVNIVQGNPAISYGAIAVVLALLAAGAERFGKS